LRRKVIQKKKQFSSVHLAAKPLKPFLHIGGVNPGFLVVAIGAMELQAINMLEAARISVLANHP
jgi:hypothetical protein